MKLRFATLVMAMVVSLPALAVYQIGETIPNMCWKNEKQTEVCLGDQPGNIHVLLYNAGWCPPCNQEFKELVPQIGEFKGKPVTFISISAEGWSRGTAPDSKFLNEWRNKHQIPFQVTGNRRDFGRDFFSPPVYIPNVVIIDSKSKLTYAEVNPGADAIMEEIRRMLP